MKLVFTFCEGPHDIAFVGRVLRASASFVSYDGTIGELPEPLPNYLKKRAEQRNIDRLSTLSIKNSKQGDPPTLWDGLVSTNGDTLILFFSCFGQDQHKKVGEFIRGFRTLSEARRESLPGEANKVATAFLYDADDAGVTEKLSVWTKRYAEHFPELGPCLSGEWASWKDEEVGWHIFSAPGSDKGQLEDIVLPLLNAAAESVHAAATTFVTENWPISTAEGKQRKAMITAAGQVHHPGDSMAVILANTEHLIDATLAADLSCQQIVTFFSGVCK